MTKEVKRGSSQKDAIEFNDASCQKLYKAAQDLYYLLSERPSFSWMLRSPIQGK